MATIETTSGEDVHVNPHGEDIVTVAVRCPRFGTICHVRLTHEQAICLSGALAGVALDRCKLEWPTEPEEPVS